MQGLISSALSLKSELLTFLPVRIAWHVINVDMHVSGRMLFQKKKDIH